MRFFAARMCARRKPYRFCDGEDTTWLRRIRCQTGQPDLAVCGLRLESRRLSRASVFGMYRVEC